MLRKIQKDQSAELFAYWRRITQGGPYHFDADEETWRSSMFSDADEEGVPMFRDLETYAFMRGAQIIGFIQYGLSSYTLAREGKDFSQSYGIIRNYHYLPGEEQAGQALLLRAMDYLGRAPAVGRHAFFHYFGMTCNARCGKLHQSIFYLEESLVRAGFSIEHENVWFSMDLRESEGIKPDVPKIEFEPDIRIGKGNEYATHEIMLDGHEIGSLTLHYLPQGGICFLRYIEIYPRYAHQGNGTRCMRELAHTLKEQGIIRLDTDTAIDNTVARGFYDKLGFRNEGVMRSYRIK